MSDKGQGILLESGTNELEALVFTLGTGRFGVNVAKVREVIGQVQVIRVPRSHPAVIGVFNLRGTVIPLVDLQLYFHPGRRSSCDHRHLIIMEFNDLLMGFVVDGVEQIYRLSWKDVEPAPLDQGSELGAVTSICHIGDHLVLMIDFEKIAFDIQGITIRPDEMGTGQVGANRATRRLLLAEDSPTMRQFMFESLRTAGYGNVTLTSNGEDAWDHLQRSVTGPASERFDVLISDVEMPRMDGLHLCKRVREHATLKTMPVVIFSSLVSEDNLKKMSAVGADATLCKPQLVKLVEIVDGLLAKRPVTV